LPSESLLSHAAVALEGLSDERGESLGVGGLLGIESLEHAKAIFLRAVLAKLEFPSILPIGISNATMALANFS
jgi:hypothetical protein